MRQIAIRNLVYSDGLSSIEVSFPSSMNRQKVSEIAEKVLALLPVDFHLFSLKWAAILNIDGTLVVSNKYQATNQNEMLCHIWKFEIEFSTGTTIEYINTSVSFFRSDNVCQCSHGIGDTIRELVESSIEKKGE